MAGWRDRIGQPGTRVRQPTTTERRQFVGILVGVLVSLALTADGLAMQITSSGQRSFGSVLVAVGGVTLITTSFVAVGKNAPDSGRRRAYLVMVGLAWVGTALTITLYAIGH